MVYYYGVKGERLGVYNFTVGYWAGGTTPTLENSTTSTETFFGARRLAPLDRLGSARSINNTASSYYPFGEDKSTNPAIDAWKFGTYWSDSASGLDYAVNRYYSSSLGRFLTADKYVNSAGPGRPGSWNRYAYVGGDPTNAGDPDGLDATAEQCIENPTYCEGSTAPGNQDSDTSCTGSVTDGFEPTPSPNCSMTFPIPMPPVLSPFRCDISLWYQSAGFEGDPFVHTFINVSVNDVVSNSTTVTDLEAGPSKGFGGYLNVLNDPQTTISGLTTSQGTNTYPTNATELFATGYGASWCAMATLLIELAQSYPQNTYGYSKPYNSNSFTYSLFQYADVSVPVWAQWILLHPALMDVPTAVGWGFLIPSWLVI